ncbi:cystine transport system substrate-binding protein [Paenibacillus sp. SORGH_AS306]|uniref:amino acid ABC transporter substrate-binding protein n=1 Tax=unclassified Paenibacillus TaxID=185978 RepID=UPI00278435D3|nr:MULTISPECIES: amino acid ABC transporter substrate-binding protein [unclassified Paenibacillus]MDQ1235227.1 cystine transport system substrate-binding protein [Paenibacillus sp. SORGH_AS_0306]MDR6112274.1 cystine transport system substrate-binding protein [Paenibacillus sp. SORGH_AS_0338]
MKKWGSFTLVMILTMLFLAACGNSSNTATTGNTDTTGAATTDNTASSGKAATLESVKASGKLRIGTEGTYAPFTFHDESGKLTGFDVDIATEVSKRLGVEPEFVETQWDGMIAGLDAKRFDTVFNEVGTSDPARNAKYLFSTPYITSKAVLIVGQDNTTLKSFTDLKDKKSAQSLTSNFGKIATENGAQLVSVDGFPQAIELLASGRADATVNDNLSFLDLKKQQPEAPIKVVAEQTDASKSAGLFNKGSEDLVQAVDKALKDMMDDGTYLKISEKYFGEDVSK